MTATANPGLVPSLGEARRLARSYDVVPLYAEFIGDLETPISAVLRFAEEDTVFLLESAESAERFGRYSFLGFDPKRTLSYMDGLYTVVDADGVREVPAGDPFRGLAEIVGKKSVAPLPNLPAFVGGAVGYFSYDAVRYLERLPDAPPDDLGVPEACFAVTDTLVVFDHLRHKVLVISLVDAARLRDVEGEGFAAAYRRAADDIRRVAERLSAPLARRGVAGAAGACRGPACDDPAHRRHAPPWSDPRGGCPTVGGAARRREGAGGARYARGPRAQRPRARQRDRL